MRRDRRQADPGLSVEPADRTLVVGLGNDILSDDAVGLLAARRVRELVGERADFVEACVATIDILPLITGYRRVIIIDALLAPDLEPGTSVVASSDELPTGFGYRSFHTLPLGQVIELGRDLGLAVPDEIVIHGLAVGDPTTFGERLSDDVELAWIAWAEEIARTEFGVSTAGRQGACSRLNTLDPTRLDPIDLPGRDCGSAPRTIE